ncbi:GGDEF domain-containing protein [Pseudooceanicola sp. CBS1P-1]|uniref:Diguanylate cyclase DosC n=1 Tax=Pseudooceanicola albus TaxID=2692189 RepID=A0A6L7FZY5_9RHOB|nr:MULTISPECIES: GGDEF domain-containing protein [Pseudooceanicola]MBT9383535.1 GGDEF domain-containing protein [Pseudooceanicola endophyticus]MXN17391.1 diguanylate cyclase [Pseudooceanicola albus]
MTDRESSATGMIRLEEEWRMLQQQTSAEVRARLARIVLAQAPRIVEEFYGVLQQDGEVNQLVPDALVQSRLATTLRDWLLALFPGDEAPDFYTMAATQATVGGIHARINLQVAHVNRAWRQLGARLQAAIILEGGAPDETLVAMLRLLNGTLNMAFELMASAYTRDNRRAAKSEEAYRLFSLGQNLSQEREAQRAAIAEWTQSVLFRITTQHGTGRRVPLWQSEFGLWLTHRGSVIFDGIAELDQVRDAIDDIDNTILPHLANEGANAPEMLLRLQGRISEVKALLGECFGAATRIEGGHDPLTRMLNRRFMDTILARELTLVRKTDKRLTVLMIDIDNFKRINDRYGHAAGDTVLALCARAVMDAVRISDFVFRYGGEEFLLALVETSEAEALGMAERLRAAIGDLQIPLGDGELVRVTASVGLAEYKGHPDYLRLVKAADEALYRAKQNGRDRIETAG